MELFHWILQFFLLPRHSSVPSGDQSTPPRSLLCPTSSIFPYLFQRSNVFRTSSTIRACLSILRTQREAYVLVLGINTFCSNSSLNSFVSLECRHSSSHTRQLLWLRSTWTSTRGCSTMQQSWVSGTLRLTAVHEFALVTDIG